MPEDIQQDPNVIETATDLTNLIIKYAKQQTLDPLKGLGRFVIFGVVGSFSLGIGIVLLSIGLLRLLQSTTGTLFSGSLSWAPYLIVMIVALVIAAIALKAALSSRKKKANK